MGKFIDLTGQRFERLEVTTRAPNYEKYSKTHGRVLKYAMWDCLCDCGKICTVLATDLKSGSQVSCGCLNDENRKVNALTHGMSDSREYQSWLSMKDRCLNKAAKHFDNYRGRGISINSDWIESFENFFEYVGECPTPKHSLDRIDTNGNYDIGNVRWADIYQQMQNQRKPKSGGNRFKLVHYNKAVGKFRARFEFNKVRYCLGYFEDETAAAREIYKLYKTVTGHYPKYIDESLKLLDLI